MVLLNKEGGKAMEKKSVKRKASNCETCEYYDFDEYYQSYTCRQSLDEDENVRFLTGSFQSCPYYKFYDEYKSVQKQN